MKSQYEALRSLWRGEMDMILKNELAMLTVYLVFGMHVEKWILLITFKLITKNDVIR
jgi:hypothetical protein